LPKLRWGLFSEEVTCGRDTHKFSGVECFNYLYIMQKILNFSGQRFGSLLVIEKVPSIIVGKKSKTAFKCICDCGTEKIVFTYALTKKPNPVRSCGCREHERGYAEPIHRLYAYAKNRTFAHKKEFTLSFDEFSKLSLSDCNYCGKSPSNKYNPGLKNGIILLYNGIDRADSSKGYVSGNCVPCCFVCNTMKNALTYEQFINHIKLLHSRLCV